MYSQLIVSAIESAFFFLSRSTLGIGRLNRLLKSFRMFINPRKGISCKSPPGASPW